MTTAFASRWRPFGWLFLFGGMTGSVLAQSALCVERDGKSYVVQKVSRGFAYIKEGDKLIPVSPQRYGLVAVPEFLPIFVSVRDLKVNGSYAVYGSTGNDINNEFNFAATFESAYTLSNPFLVLEMETETGGKRVFFQEIGPLGPGQPQPVYVHLPLSEKLGPGRYKLHLFTEGMEVFHSEQPWAYREGVLNQMVLKRIAGVKDALPQQFVGPEPEYPAALRKARVKGNAVVTVRITARGEVFDPELASATDPAFGKAALAAVVQWRFLPRVKDGRPIETHAHMPFAFEAPAEKEKP